MIYKLTAPAVELAARVWWVLPDLSRRKVRQICPRYHRHYPFNGKLRTGVDEERSQTPYVSCGHGDLQLSSNIWDHNSMVHTRPSPTAKSWAFLQLRKCSLTVTRETTSTASASSAFQAQNPSGNQDLPLSHISQAFVVQAMRQNKPGCGKRWARGMH